MLISPSDMALLIGALPWSNAKAKEASQDWLSRGNDQNVSIIFVN
jgi:hypothetical protein